MGCGVYVAGWVSGLHSAVSFRRLGRMGGGRSGLKRVAKAGESQRDELTGDWMIRSTPLAMPELRAEPMRAEPMRVLKESAPKEPGAGMPKPAVVAPAVTVAAVDKLEASLRTERALTALWWRDQVAELDRAAKERGESLKGGEAVQRGQARVFGALGMPTDVVAALMGVNEGAFQAQYGDAYAVGSATMLAQVAANYLRIATSTNDRYAVKAAGDIMNRRGGEPWRQPAQKLEVSRPSAKANLIDSSKLTFDERQALKAIIMAATAREGMAALENGADE